MKPFFRRRSSSSIFPRIFFLDVQLSNFWREIIPIMWIFPGTACSFIGHLTSAPASRHMFNMQLQFTEVVEGSVTLGKDLQHQHLYIAHCSACVYTRNACFCYIKSIDSEQFWTLERSWLFGRFLNFDFNFLCCVPKACFFCN